MSSSAKCLGIVSLFSFLRWCNGWSELSAKDGECIMVTDSHFDGGCQPSVIMGGIEGNCTPRGCNFGDGEVYKVYYLK